MKMKAGVACAALEWVLDRGGVAPTGAMSLRLISEHWRAIHLRSSDLGSAIEMMIQRERITLEARGGGLWLRRRDRANSSGVDKVWGALRELMHKRALQRMLRRNADFDYAGENRRRPGAAAQA